MAVRLIETKEITCRCGQAAEVRKLMGTVGQEIVVVRCSNQDCEVKKCA